MKKNKFSVNIKDAFEAGRLAGLKEAYQDLVYRIPVSAPQIVKKFLKYKLKSLSKEKK